jgi:hypothetical protein
MAQKFLPVEAAANFVDEARREGMGVGKRNGIVAAVVLRKAQPDIACTEAFDRRVGYPLSGNVVNAIQVIILGKIVIEAQRSGVLYRTAGKVGLEPTRDASIRGIDGSAETDLWEVGIDQILNRRIQQPRWNVTNRRLPSSSRIVLSAISVGVNTTLSGTSGLAESFTAEKSPVYSDGCAALLS